MAVIRVADGNREKQPGSFASLYARDARVLSVLAAKSQPSLREVAQGLSGGALLLEGLFAFFGNEKQRETAWRLFEPTARVFAATLIPPLPQPTFARIEAPPQPQPRFLPTNRVSSPNKLVLKPMTEQRLQIVENTQGEIARQLGVLQAEVTLVREHLFGEPDSDTP